MHTYNLTKFGGTQVFIFGLQAPSAFCLPIPSGIIQSNYSSENSKTSDLLSRQSTQKKGGWRRPFGRSRSNSNLVTRASRLCGGNGIGLGGEESTTWKPSRLQGVGLMGMPADDPLRQTQRSYSTVSLLHLVRGEKLSR